jgi:hypothetical protein
MSKKSNHHKRALQRKYKRTMGHNSKEDDDRSEYDTNNHSPIQLRIRDNIVTNK